MKLCASCGVENWDKARFCAKCGAKLETPAASTSPGSQSSGAQLPNKDCEIKFHCTACGQAIQAPTNMAGGQITCPRCQKLIKIPVVQQGRAGRSSVEVPVSSVVQGIPQPEPTDVSPSSLDEIQAVASPGSGLPRQRKRILVFIAAISAGVLLIVVAVTCFPRFAQHEDKIEDYKPCNPSLNFGIEEVTCQGDGQGGWEFCTFKKLLVNNTEIPVVTTTVEKGGFFLTKDFGKIMIRVQEIGPRGTKLQVLVTPRQEKQLNDFLGIKSAPVTAGGSGRAATGVGASSITTPKHSQKEPSAWATATKIGTPTAFAEYFKLYPDSSRIKVRTGTLRGRYWCKQTDANHQRGVLVTVKGTDLLVNISLEEAERLEVIGAKLATTGLITKARAQSFRYLFAEIVEGGYIVVHAVNKAVITEVIEPKDSEGATLVLSADGSRLLTWDLRQAISSAHPDTQPTFVAAAATMRPFNEIPSDINKAQIPESQGLNVSTKN